jgi:hypothetical protein
MKLPKWLEELYEAGFAQTLTEIESLPERGSNG